MFRRSTSSDSAAKDAAGAKEETQQPLRLRIVTYNVLSSKLAEPTHFTTVNPEHLKAENRLPIILNKLQEQMDNATNDNGSSTPTIFCLQEVSYEWAGALHIFFANRGYHMATALYGKTFNGYMGVALAWPLHDIETLDVDICRLADTYEWPEKEPENKGLVNRLTHSVASLWTASLQTLGLASDHNDKNDDPPDHWDLSQRRVNALLTAALRHKATDTKFVVANYHMPCAFYCPMAMTMHADLAAAHVRDVAVRQESTETTTLGNPVAVPFVLAGDFNMKSHEPVYQMLTEGELPDKDSPFDPTPHSETGTEWASRWQGDTLQSAYVVKLGSEPDFTNYAQTGSGKEEGEPPEPFVDTLDYIFCSRQWQVESVLGLPHRDKAGGPFPNLDVGQPSDHLLLAADLSLAMPTTSKKEEAK